MTESTNDQEIKIDLERARETAEIQLGSPQEQVITPYKTEDLLLVEKCVIGELLF